jgi:metallophosphoesterase (TIGR00282 family)
MRQGGIFRLAGDRATGHRGPMLKILFIGDIVGRPGRDIVAAEVPRLRAELGLDLVIANAENAAAGAGLNGGLAKAILAAGVDVITLGDHVWDQRGFETEIGTLERVCRPANLPASCPGRDHVIVEGKGVRLAVFTVLGRTFMGLKAECPFLAADTMLAKLGGAADAAFVEIHAEATSEKQALGRHLDGRAVAVVGTHTHVPTADAAVLPRGTAFLCDAGMTGPYDSVLGREVAPVVARFLDGMPRKFGVAEGDVRLSGVVVEYDPAARRATRCELLTVCAERS